jgi:ATP/maltotriose-dependent transcriptional regulator MalT
MTMQQAHATFYLALAEMAELKLTGAEQGIWFERLQQEHENIKAALQWFMQQQEWEKALRLSNALWRFWWARGYLNEGRQALEQALNACQKDELPTNILAQALNAVGVLAGMQGDFGQSEAHCQDSLSLLRPQGDLQCCAISLWMLGNVALMKSNCAAARSFEEEALTLFREVDDAWGIASSLERLASVATDEGDFNQAILYGEQALAFSRASGDTWGTARSLDRLGFVTFTQGNIARTESLLTESVLLSRKIGDKRTLAYSLAIMGYVACARGNYIAGHAALEESMKLSMEVGDRRGRVWGLSGLGWAFFSQGDFAAARDHYEESLTILLRSDYAYKSFIALGLEGLAGAVSALGHLTWAARLWGAAETIHTTDDGPPVPLILQPVYERLIAILHTQLGESAFKHSWDTGKTMTLEQVILEQEQEQETSIIVPPSSAALQASLVTLTTREKDVLRLLATGLTSAQISEKLFITVLTVNTHIRSIYSKIGVNSRSAATRYAIDHQLA